MMKAIEALALVTGSVEQELMLRNEYVAAENEIFRSKINGRIQFNDSERIRLAKLGKKLGTKALKDVAAIVKPETILEWFRKLVAKKFDGSNKQNPAGRPKTNTEIEAHIAGITTNPDEQFMLQIARNSTMQDWGFLCGRKHFIIDRDSKYTTAFRAMIKASGVKVIRLPPKSPNLNAHCERWVLSVKSEMLSRMLFFGVTSLREALRLYVDHYHEERNHQGKDNPILFPKRDHSQDEGDIKCSEKLGGLLKFYHREAA